MQYRESPSRGNVIWSVLIACIGFGGAVYRYLQFSGLLAESNGMRLSRLERPLYRLAGKWGLVAVLMLIGLIGLYYTIKYYKQARTRQ